MLLARTAAPSDLISLADIKAHLRIDHSYDDTTLDAVRVVAANWLDGRDGYLQRSLLTQTWEWRLPCFPWSNELHFPLPPLQSITSIQYYDETETLQTFASSNYYTYTQAPNGYAKLKQTSYWPATYVRDDAVIATFVSGYGAAAAVPVAIKQAALLACGRLYSNRGDGAMADATQFAFAEMGISSAEKALLAPYRVQEFQGCYERNWS